LTELWRLSATALADRFAAGTASPVEATESALARIADVDPVVAAFSFVQAERALADAHARTEELVRGHRRGPLHGVPIAVKELFDVCGAPNDYGSETLRGRRATDDAELVRRLRHAGAIVVGTTRSHEFGWGITTQHPTRGGTRNPWDPDRIPGGSSGGSAAAVATGMVPVAVGSDTGGSIRIPASFCGVAGLKPTFGLVGRTGGVALAPSFDTPGALGRSIDDVATVVATMSGDDPGDPACAGRRFEFDRAVPSSLTGVRVGTSPALVDVDLEAGVAHAYDAAMTTLTELGADVMEIELPAAGWMLETFVPLQMAEAYYVHHRALGLFPERADEYGYDVRGRLERASSVSAVEYISAQERRRQIVAAFDRALRRVDALMSPISAVAPSRINRSDTAEVNGEHRPLREVVMRFTVPQNLTGLPTAIVRAGFDHNHLPVGVQFTAARWCEGTALAIAAALQLALGPIDTVPELHRQDGR
jgi:aspartyl-tRNA(Asn)/glutamyl-tRNA(Gln) amidotransferase subunit A